MTQRGTILKSGGTLISKKTSVSLANPDGLSKPANTLINRVADLIGGLGGAVRGAAGVWFEPYQITRIAKAEAKAAAIRTQSEIERDDLRRRAVRRFVEEEAQQQENMEDITRKAIPHVAEDATPDSVEKDWMVNFFDKSRIVSDDDMQELWSRVLAGEANRPGSYSRRTVNFLSDLDKTDAELFSTLCRFGWFMGDIVPLVFDYKDKIYTDFGVTFDMLTHLESIGFIQFTPFTFVKEKLPKDFSIAYYVKPLQLSLPNSSENTLEIGHVLLTKVGQELAPICRSQPVEGFWEYVLDKWKEYVRTTNTN